MTLTLIDIFTFAGTLASILGVFFAIYAKQNGKVTRDLMHQIHQETQELINSNQQQTQQTLQQNHQQTQHILERMEEREQKSDQERRKHEQFMEELLARVHEKVR